MNIKEIKETPKIEESLSVEEVLRVRNCIFMNLESLELVTQLKTRGETTFREITRVGEEFGIDRAKVSHYLAMLEDCGLLERGYRLSPPDESGRGKAAQTFKLDTEKLDQVLVGLQHISDGLMSKREKREGTGVKR